MCCIRFVLFPLGSELLAGAGDEWRAHWAQILAVLPAGVGSSFSCDHSAGYCTAGWLRLDHLFYIWTGAGGCVSILCFSHMYYQRQQMTCQDMSRPIKWMNKLVSVVSYASTHRNLSLWLECGGCKGLTVQIVLCVCLPKLKWSFLLPHSAHKFTLTLHFWLFSENMR